MIQKRAIRIATPLDANTISTIYLTSRKKYIHFAPLIHSDDAIFQWIHDILIPNVNWIDQLYILPKATGHGVGSLLIDKAKSLGRTIRLHTFQENLNARRFYERHGFKILAFSNRGRLNNDLVCIFSF